MEKSIAIIGAGNGGQAFAAYLSLHGHRVKIFDVVQKTVDELNRLGGVEITGHSDVTGFGKIELASTDIGKVIEGTDIILVVLPSLYHRSMARAMAPYLKDGQYVILNPNASLGTVEFRKQLDDCGSKADITLCCTATLLFACRADRVGHVIVAGQKTGFTASAYPASRNAAAAKIMKNVVPQWNFCEDIIRVSLDNLNAFMHPAPTLLNTGRIESGADFEYYLGMTPSQGAVVDALDKERMSIGKAFCVHLRTLVDEYKYIYDTHGENIYEVCTNAVNDYKGIKGQKTLRTRYVLEDIPCSLVAIQTLGQIAGVPTPTADAVITLARAMVPELEEGRTRKNLGLEAVTKEQFIQMCRG
jgi:opine dehydrogenase